ncbi:hypothetical protein E3J74_07660 [Candidatus Bathyarchaeota archaeon]|nr:MAG: hypothetical protein E3J74_07660 [Candidatus Bathyarchaeota archaeon]TEU05615.1 MAG: hypothetical protein E3I90_03950 [Candidatus Bathyarchaeota archaeon]
MSESKTMKPEQDAFGQMMWAYYKGKEVCEIVERDDGYFSAYHGPKVYFSEYRDWPLIGLLAPSMLSMFTSWTAEAQEIVWNTNPTPLPMPTRMHTCMQRREGTESGIFYLVLHT